MVQTSERNSIVFDKAEGVKEKKITEVKSLHRITGGCLQRNAGTVWNMGKRAVKKYLWRGKKKRTCI
jgi:hypothetical protein